MTAFVFLSRRYAPIAGICLLITITGVPIQAQFFRGAPTGADVSPQHPTLFRFSRNPEVLCFFPGNRGSAVFRSSSPEPTAGANSALGELKCNGQLIVLDDPSYKLRATGSKSNAQEWWDAIAGALAGSPQYISDLRVTDSLLEGLERSGQEAIAQFSRRLVRLLGSGATLPLISFETSGEKNQRTAGELRDALREEFPNIRLGRVLNKLPKERDGIRGWNFVVVNPEILPAWLRGQAAVSALHARLGPIPVILQFSRPDFYRDMVSLATGAAGFQYGPLPLKSGPEADMQFRSLRAFTTLKSRMREGGVRLMPELAGGGALGALGVPGETYCLFLLRGGRALFDPPLMAGQPDYIAMWYRAATDETIMLPRKSRNISEPEKLELVAPSRDAAWIYCYGAVPSLDDWQTTTPVVVPEVRPVDVGANP